MPQRMLIDATRPGETRVVVLNGDRVEEFDYETATKTQLKGNIYLAKVTRVEPSLQAAFLEYGGNRHGFLPFSEIHPDYYQIPVADRQALLNEEAAQHAADEAKENGAEEKRKPSGRRSRKAGAAEADSQDEAATQSDDGGAQDDGDTESSDDSGNDDAPVEAHSHDDEREGVRAPRGR